MSNNSTNTGRVIRLDPQDNVVVAPNEIPVGTFIASEHVTTLHKVPAGHKIATRLIRQGEPVLKYNTVIGFAGEDTPPGSWMHSHNILFDDFERDYAFSKNYQPVDLLPPEQRATFQGLSVKMVA